MRRGKVGRGKVRRGKVRRGKVRRGGEHGELAFRGTHVVFVELLIGERVGLRARRCLLPRTTRSRALSTVGRVVMRHLRPVHGRA